MASARPEERKFKAVLSMTKSGDSSPVFFKVDGERFKESRTLKLQVDTAYKVVLEFRPPMVLSDASISGSSIKPEMRKNDDNCTVYDCTFSTQGMLASKSKDRSYMVLCLKFTDMHELTIQIQSKMYSQKDKNHAMWGSCLKSLEFECKMKDGQNFVDVMKTIFR